MQIAWQFILIFYKKYLYGEFWNIEFLIHGFEKCQEKYVYFIWSCASLSEVYKKKIFLKNP